MSSDVSNSFVFIAAIRGKRWYKQLGGNIQILWILLFSVQMWSIVKWSMEFYTRTDSSLRNGDYLDGLALYCIVRLMFQMWSVSWLKSFSIFQIVGPSGILRERMFRGGWWILRLEKWNYKLAMWGYFVIERKCFSWHCHVHLEGHYRRSPNFLCFRFQLSFGSLVAVDEKLTYQPCPDNVSKTLLRQEAIVTVHGVPLSNYLENILTNNISCNASKVNTVLIFCVENRECHWQRSTAVLFLVVFEENILLKIYRTYAPTSSFPGNS